MMTASNYQTGMRLSQLLDGLSDQPIREDITVHGLTLDSREVTTGDVFIALSGTQQHGADYIPAAVEAGASAIIYEADYTLELPKLTIPIISVDQLTKKAGEIAHRFYQLPSNDIRVIGITGTNGKTSTAWFLAQALQRDNDSVGFIGTLGTGLFGELQASANTTPDAISVHRSLAEFRNQGADYVVIEVSSHALQQYRVAAVNFYSVIFTNLSRDHLDYHGSMQRYAESKQRLFTDYASQFQIINADDAYGREFIIQESNNVYRYSITHDIASDDEHSVCAKILQTDDALLSLALDTPWGSDHVRTQLTGEFNAYNILAVISVLCVSGMSLQEAISRVETLTSVPGRMQAFTSDKDRPTVVVDYAHTPDALEKVLQSLHKQTTGKLFCVFGCGGERDQGKRSVMGTIAGQYADCIILTNDNPRMEDPSQILRDIQHGISEGAVVQIEPDRAKAIALAIASSNSGDIVLVAGKGHEDYQIIGNQTIDFDDRIWVKQLLESDGD